MTFHQYARRACEGTLMLSNVFIPVSNVKFHKKLQSKRLPSVLIKEITRPSHLAGIVPPKPTKSGALYLSAFVAHGKNDIFDRGQANDRPVY